MIWPIKVLKANDIIVAIATPIERVLVSKISAGTIHDRGPLVAEKEKLYNQVTTMKPHPAPVLLVLPGGKDASKAVAMMKVTQLNRLPLIMAHRRPV